MWAELALACALAAALLVAPGALCLRALGMRPAASIASGPLLSIVAYGIVAVVLGALGIPASMPLVAAPLLIVALALVAVRARRGALRRPGCIARHELRVLGLYVAAGVAVTGVMLVANLGEADSFVQAWDNVAHFNIIRSMKDSGTWSTLLTSYYSEGTAAASPFPSAPHFYPAAWHLTAVMLVDALGVPVTLAANAVNALTCAALYPMGIWLLLSRVFARRPRVVALGAVTCLAFSSFPWNLIPRWTLYPILFSLALMPAVIAAFMQLTARVASRRSRALSAAVFVVGGVALALAQPSSVFSAAVFLAPWCAWRVFEWRRSRGSSPARAAAWAAAFLACAALVWMGCALAPFMHSVVGYYWPPICSLGDAIDYVLNLTFCDHTERPALCLIVAVGLVAALVRRSGRWVVAPFAFCVAAFVVAAAGEDTPLKHLLVGFWYTDPYRVAAMAVIFCAPIAALGLFTLARAAERAICGLLAARARRGAGPTSGTQPCPARAALPLACALAAFGLYAPALLARLGLPQPWANDDFAVLSWQLAEKGNEQERLGYSAEKQAFVDRVLELVGPDELILNMPYDGSVYAYGVSGLNVFYRNMDGYGVASKSVARSDEARSQESRESVVMRKGLAWIADGRHERTVEALEEAGIRYVLILDRNDEEMLAAFYTYMDWRWYGILSVEDDTSGFEVVLADGDMRLYRIALPE